ncbi:hypothetical protein C1949_13275 [Halopseudomonas oceani]|uniref:DNA-binding protein n=1 Tax=Halopseudomonas oceani TaxID=1708783 RepID=A0A2P4ET11_9GAMM|nr:hypothetical protein [Halopseudomonas oceani]POB02412.1 hypothetical protein C1949_13275 [Halopseudomonas oceani]
MESIQERAITLIYMTGLDELVRKSPIGHARWKNVRHKTTRISSEELDVLVAIYPQYALWLAGGKIAPECGQTSPEYDEANRNLTNHHAG